LGVPFGERVDLVGASSVVVDLHENPVDLEVHKGASSARLGSFP